ncbi:MAG: sigma-54 dependent transcriptional regulator [Pontixanthobacter sp.]
MKNVLLVEDDVAIATIIETALKQEGFAVTRCDSVAERNAALTEDTFDILLTDIVLKDGDGIADMSAIQMQHPLMPIIILSAQNTLDTAIRATEAGAFEYFPKPFDLDALISAVSQAVGTGGAGAPEVVQASGDLPLVGRSAAMQGVYRMITRVLSNDLTVLVLGESGTGKELVAEAIHELGHRKTGPFVAINAGAIPADLIESELFGHERGAFTGAIKQSIGKFEQANGGTLFLDEIGDMPFEAQTRLLRALQSGRIRRVGGQQDIAIDVRIIAATNRNLQPMIVSGAFREDLFYRLNVVPIELPPLRERRDDIEPLAQHFLKEATKEGLPYRQIDKSALVLLKGRDWRGNVRELRNALYRLILLSRDDVIGAATVCEALGNDTAQSEAGEEMDLSAAFRQWARVAGPPAGHIYHAALAAFERPMFEWALAQTDGNQLRAAKLLGINRNTLYKRIVDLNIDRP